jgi:hypothetical protein
VQVLQVKKIFTVFSTSESKFGEFEKFGNSDKGRLDYLIDIK